MESDELPEAARRLRDDDDQEWETFAKVYQGVAEVLVKRFLSFGKVKRFIS